MKDNNLDTAPTKQELDNAGFFKAGVRNQDDQEKMMKRINDRLFIMFSGKECSLLFLYGNLEFKIKEIKPTKAAINKELEHFGKPLPEWSPPKPKPGEVWSDGLSTLLILKGQKNVLNIEGPEYRNFESWQTAIRTNFEKFEKKADSLEEYYLDKQMITRGVKVPYS
jgi:hypothetical protein